MSFCSIDFNISKKYSSRNQDLLTASLGHQIKKKEKKTFTKQCIINYLRSKKIHNCNTMEIVLLKSDEIPRRLLKIVEMCGYPWSDVAVRSTCTSWRQNEHG